MHWQHMTGGGAGYEGYQGLQGPERMLLTGCCASQTLGGIVLLYLSISACLQSHSDNGSLVKLRTS